MQLAIFRTAITFAVVCFLFMLSSASRIGFLGIGRLNLKKKYRLPLLTLRLYFSGALVWPINLLKWSDQNWLLNGTAQKEAVEKETANRYNLIISHTASYKSSPAFAFYDEHWPASFTFLVISIHYHVLLFIQDTLSSSANCQSNNNYDKLYATTRVTGKWSNARF